MRWLGWSLTAFLGLAAAVLLFILDGRYRRDEERLKAVYATQAGTVRNRAAAGAAATPADVQRAVAEQDAAIAALEQGRAEAAAAVARLKGELAAVPPAAAAAGGEAEALSAEARRFHDEIRRLRAAVEALKQATGEERAPAAGGGAG
ncbi:MAG: hypothetical protein WC789_07555 [Lentisphaeria bacterium]|jgi:chromosome segregation ATPase